MIKTVTVPRPTATEGQDSSAQGNSANNSLSLPADSILLDPVMNGLPNVGRKNDTGKLRYDLVSPLWEEGLVAVMTGAPGVGGAGEYGDRNWEQGIAMSRCYAALRRHLAAKMRGEDIDPKSGLDHCFHINACAMFLWAMPSIHPEMDDRQAVAICSVQKLNVATPTDQESE